MSAEPTPEREPEPQELELELPGASSLLISWLLIAVLALIVIIGLLMLAMRSAG